MQVGAEVTINKDSKYYTADDAWNPKNTVGTIIGNDGSNLGIRVRWDQNKKNWYSANDLDLVNRKPLYKKVVKPFRDIPDDSVFILNKVFYVKTSKSFFRALKVWHGTGGAKEYKTINGECTHIEGLTSRDIYESLKDMVETET